MSKRAIMTVIVLSIITVLAVVLLSTSFFTRYPFDLVQDEATAIRIASKSLGKLADDYPIVQAKAEGDHWVVGFSMGENVLGGVVVINVDRNSGQIGAVQRYK